MSSKLTVKSEAGEVVISNWDAKADRSFKTALRRFYERLGALAIGFVVGFMCHSYLAK